MHGGAITWSDSCLYLAIHFDVHLDVNSKMPKLVFFLAFNSIYGKVGGFASEYVVSNLVRSKCVLIFLNFTKMYTSSLPKTIIGVFNHSDLHENVSHQFCRSG